MVYQGTSQFNITISGNMINPNSEIIFMPLHRSIKPQAGAKSAGGGQSKASAKSSAAQVEKPLEAGATTLVKIVQPKAKPKLSKKEAKKAEAKKALDAKNEKAKKIDKSLKKENPARPAVSAEAQQSEGRKPVEGNEHASDKPEAKVETKNPQNAQEVSAAANSNQNSNSSASSDVAVGSSDNVVYVGQAEMDALQAQEYIQQELAQHWAPPSGMRSDLFAVVTLTVDFEGAIKKVDLVTSSGNLLFDTAAKKAAALITPARWTYGKELSITFKP